MFFTRKDSNFDSYSYLTHSSFPKDPDRDEWKLGRCLKANLGWFRDPFVSFYPTEGLSVYSAPYSVQFSQSVLSDYLQLHGLQHATLSYPSPTPGACSNLCRLSQWYHPTILSSVIPFFSCLQSFPASRCFPMSQFFTSGGQYWSFSISISPSNDYSGLVSFRIDWFDLLAVQGTLKSLLQYHSPKASVLRCSAFFIVQLSHPYVTTGRTIALTRWTTVGKVMSLLFNMLSRY